MRGNRLSFLLSVSALLAGAPAFAVDIWSGLSTRGNTWSDRDNWVSGSAPANDSSAHIVMSGGFRPINEADGLWFIRFLEFQGTTTAFDISGVELRIVEGIRNNDAHAHVIRPRVITNGPNEWCAAGGQLVFTNSVSVNHETRIIGTEQVSFARLGGTSPIFVDGPPTTLYGSVSTTLSGRIHVEDGELNLQKTDGAEAVAGDLTIGDDVGAAGSAWVTVHLDEQITRQAGREVVILEEGVLKLDDSYETIRDLELHGGAVTRTGASELDIDGIVRCTADGSDIAVPLHLDGPTEFDVSDGENDFQLSVVGDILSGSIRKTGPGGLRLDGRAMSGTTFVDEGTLTVYYQTGVVFPAGSAINVGTDGPPRTADLVITRAGQIDPSVAVTVQPTGRILASGVQAIDEITMRGGTSYFFGELTLGRLEVESTHGYLVADPLQLEGRTTVIEVPDTPDEYDCILSGTLECSSAGTLQKEGAGRLRLEASHTGPVHGACREGEMFLNYPYFFPGDVLHSVEVGGACPAESVVRFGFVELTSGGDWTVAACGRMDLDGLRQLADVVTMTGGVLDIDGGHVDANSLSATVDATIDLGDGGVLELVTGLDFAGTFVGSGTILFDGEVVNGGLMDPGSSPGSILVDADFRQPFGGAMHLEIAGTDPSQYDHIDATGDVVLEGGTITVEFIDGFVPEPGDTFPLVTGATVTVGDVEVIAPDGYDVDVETGELVLMADCREDLDGSGVVDFGDILALLGAWGSTGGPADLDGSGTVDFGDLLVVLGAWGPCP